MALEPKVVAQGTFRIDRRRAQDKLAHFQLQDPNAYVLELVAAAVRGSASEITIRNDADDFEMEWDGEAPTQQEITDLFDALFITGDGPHERMLHHLALGINGALGLDPKWLKLERPGLTVELHDLVDIHGTPSPRERNVWIWVRERLGWKVVSEAFGTTRERSLLEARAPFAPVSITLNGKALRRPAVPTDRPVHRSEDRALWWSEGGGGVVLVRDGIVIEPALEGSSRGLAWAGWIRDDGLKVDASAGRAVADEQLDLVRAKVVDGLATALLEMFGQGRVDRELLDTTAEALCTANPAIDCLDDVVTLPDGAGRNFTLKALRAADRIFAVSHEKLFDPFVPDPQFLVTEAADAPSLQARWALVEAVGGSSVTRDLQELEVALAGRALRKERAQLDLRFDDFPAAWKRLERLGDHEVVWFAGFSGGARSKAERSFDHVPVRGLCIEVWCDGVPMRRYFEQKCAGPVLVRVRGSSLKAARSFTTLASADVLHQLLASTQVRLPAILALALGESAHPSLQELALAWLREHPIAKKGKDLVQQIRDTLPPTLLQGLTVPSADGHTLILMELVSTLSEHGKVPYIRADAPLEGLSARVPVLDDTTLKALQRVFGKRLEDATEHLTDDLARERRKRTATAEPSLPKAISSRPFAVEGIAGVIGTDHGTDSWIEVIHQGVMLTRIPVPTPRGVQASVAWEAAVPNRRWDGLHDPESQQALLLAACLPALWEVAVEASLRWIDRVTSGGAALPLPPYVRSVLAETTPLPEALARCPLFATLEGGSTSLSALTPPVQVVDAPQPKLPAPGILVVDAGRKALLEKRFGLSQVNDQIKRVDRMRATRAAFFSDRPRAQVTPGRHVGFVNHAATVGGRAIRVRCALVLDATVERLETQVLHEDRVLTSWSQGHPIAVEAWVSGDGVIPNEGLTAVVDETGLKAAVTDAVQVLVTQAATVDFALLPTMLARKLFQSLDELHPTRAAELKAQLRRRPLLDAHDRTMTPERLELLLTTGKRVRGATAKVLPHGPQHDPSASWILLDGPTQAVLDHFGIVVEDASAALLHRRIREERLLKIQVETVPVSGDFLASWLVTGLESIRIFMALVRGPAARTITWLVESRPLLVTKDDYPCALQVRVLDPELTADPSFQAVSNPTRQEATQKEIEATLARFFEGIAAVLVQAPVDPRLSLNDPSAARLALLAWARHQPTPPLWEHRVLPTSDGKGLAIRDLPAASKGGPLRVVGPDARGQTLDPVRPAFCAGPELRAALERWGSTQFFAHLEKEDEAVRRRDAPPIPRIQPASPGPGTLLETAVPGGRGGALRVTAMGDDELTLCWNWRVLGRMTAAGPVPLGGVIDDPSLEPDWLEARFIKNEAWKQLESDLRAHSEALLPQMVALGSKNPTPELARLLRRVVCRRFRDPIEFRDAKGIDKGLLELPIFETNDPSRAWSAHELGRLPAVRWVRSTLRNPGLDAPGTDDPFVFIHEDEYTPLHVLFEGAWADEEAQRAIQIASLRAFARPLSAPDPSSYLAYLALDDPFEARLGLAHPMNAGSIRLAIHGAVIGTVAVDQPGFEGLLAVDEARLDQPILTDAEMQWLDERYLELLNKALPRITTGADADARAFRAALEPRLRQSLRSRRPFQIARGWAAWWQAPLLPTPEGRGSLADAVQSFAEHGAVVVEDGSKPHPTTPFVIVDNDRMSRWWVEIVRPDDGRILARAEWSATLDQRSEQDREARWLDAAYAKASERAQTLMAGLPGAKGLVEESLRRKPAIHEVRPMVRGGGEAAEWLLAWWALDHMLVHADRGEVAAEVALRLMEQRGR